MLIRTQIKARAKQALSTHYGIGLGLYILPALCIFAVTYVLSLATASTSSTLATVTLRTNMAMLPQQDITMAILVPLIITQVLMIPVTLVNLAMSVGTGAGYIRLFRDLPASVTEPFRVFGQGFWRKLGGMAKVALFVFLWALLAVVPFIATIGISSVSSVSNAAFPITNFVAMALYLFGIWLLIYKLLGYSLTEYILAEYPGISGGEAIRLSNRMMKGHRGELFMAGLSFFWWILLGAITLNILTIFYVAPYMYITFAGFYTKFRDMALLSGVIAPEELGDSLMAVPAPESEPEAE